MHSGIQIGILLKATRYRVDFDKYENVSGISNIEASIESGLGYMFSKKIGIDARITGAFLKLDGIGERHS